MGALRIDIPRGSGCSSPVVVRTSAEIVPASLLRRRRGRKVVSVKAASAVGLYGPGHSADVRGKET